MNSSLDRQLSIWQDEYRSLSADITARVDLQQKNMNVCLVALTAIAGYIFNYWNSHSLNELRTGQLATLVVIAPLLGLVFVWRHLDHDANIIEKASYLYHVVRPRMVAATGDNTVIGFEEYLRMSRFGRFGRLGPLWVLGNEHVIPLAYIGAFYVYAWDLRAESDGRAGDAKGIFDWLLYVGSGLLIVTVVMAVATSVRYATVTSQNALQKGTPSSVPASAPSVTPTLVKATASTKTYHVPGGRYYDRVVGDILFATEAEALAAGYKASKH